MSVLGSIFTALFLPKRSNELLLNGKGKTFMCLFLVLTLSFSMIFIVPTISAFNHFFDFVRNEVPHFLISSDGLVIEKPYVLNTSVFYLELNNRRNFTSAELQAYAGYPVVVICDASRITLMMFGEQARGHYLDIGSFSFSPQWILAEKDFLFSLCCITLFFMYVFFFVGILLAAVIYSVIGLIFNRLFRAALTFGEIYKLCLYAVFLPYILLGILALRSYLLFLSLGSCIALPLTLIMLGIYIFYMRTPNKPSEDNGGDDAEKPKVIRI